MRQPISKRLRFEIFKRDNFRCRYCGADQTRAILVVDHVEPVVDGGSSSPDNLVTACEECNSGKSAIPLSERKFRLNRPKLLVIHHDREHEQRMLDAVADAHYKAFRRHLSHRGTEGWCEFIDENNLDTRSEWHDRILFPMEDDYDAVV